MCGGGIIFLNLKSSSNDFGGEQNIVNSCARLNDLNIRLYIVELDQVKYFALNFTYIKNCIGTYVIRVCK